MIFEERIYPLLYLEVTLDVDFIKEKSMQQVEMACRGIRINQFFFNCKDISLQRYIFIFRKLFEFTTLLWIKYHNYLYTEIWLHL